MRLVKSAAATAIAAVLAAPAALAEEHGGGDKAMNEGARALKTYAAMAKLEANVAEASGAVMLAAASAGNETVRAEAMKDFQSDAGQIDKYVTALEDMDLSGDRKEALDTFKSEWRGLSNTGRALIENADDSSIYREKAFEWWQNLDAVDDTLDEQLEAILDEQNAAVAG